MRKVHFVEMLLNWFICRELINIANQTLVGHDAWADMIIPTITPNNPSALPKISITRIFTKSDEFWASDSAQLLPMIPTHNLPSRRIETDQVQDNDIFNIYNDTLPIGVE